MTSLLATFAHHYTLYMCFKCGDITATIYSSNRTLVNGIRAHIYGKLINKKTNQWKRDKVIYNLCINIHTLTQESEITEALYWWK